MKVAMAFAVALVLAGASTPVGPPRSPEAQSKLDRLLAGRVAGEPKRCLLVRQVLHPIAIDDETLVFPDGPRMWVNQLRGSVQCGKLDKMSDIAFESGGPNVVCSGKTLYFSNNGLEGACALGDFVPYAKP